MSTITLTPVQHAILAYALEHSDGRIDWFPEHIQGGARRKVLDGLANRALIARQGEVWVVADAGYEALGVQRPGARTAQRQSFVAKLDAVIARAEQAQTARDEADLEAAASAAEAAWAQDAHRSAAPRPQQAGAGDRDVETPRRRHHRADLRGHGLAGAHGTRHLCRRAQEEVGPEYRLREDRRACWHAGCRAAPLPHCRGSHRVSTQPDDPIPADLLPAVLTACREIARVQHPSIEHLLRHRGFGFEADRIADLVLAIEALDAQHDAD